MGRPRILLVSGSSPPRIDGVGHYSFHLAAGIARARPDWAVAWLSRRPRRIGLPVSRESGVLRLRPGHTWSSRGRHLAALAARIFRPDLVHVQEETHSFHETDAALRVAKAAPPGRLVTTFHEIHPSLPSLAHSTALARASAVVIANDRRTFDRCRTYCGRQPEHLFWSPANVLPPDGAAGLPRRAGNGNAAVVTFGQISPDKQLECVFEALSRARRTTPLAWKIVGPFDPFRNPYHRGLRERISAAGGDSWVRFEGGFDRLDDPRLRSLLSDADLAILLFEDGASPRRGSLQAAWAFGLPVITTSPPADEPEVRDGTNCALASSETTAEELSGIVSELLRDSARATALRKGALATAEKFSWNRLVELHVGLYEGLLASRNTSSSASRWGPAR